MPKARIPEVAHLPVTFHAKKDHVVAIFHIGESTIGIRFEHPEQILHFFVQMMDKAAIVWPDDPNIQEYLSQD
jgi:hypothetical protein